MSIYLKSIINKLTPESRRALDSLLIMQCRRSHNEVDCLHFLWKLLEEHNKLLRLLMSYLYLILTEF